eukprot:6198746-Pleurochrysis_carterae.AAC.1
MKWLSTFSPRHGSNPSACVTSIHEYWGSHARSQSTYVQPIYGYCCQRRKKCISLRQLAAACVAGCVSRPCMSFSLTEPLIPARPRCCLTGQLRAQALPGRDSGDAARGTLRLQLCLTDRRASQQARDRSRVGGTGRVPACFLCCVQGPR